MERMVMERMVMERMVMERMVMERTTAVNAECLAGLAAAELPGFPAGGARPRLRRGDWDRVPASWMRPVASRIRLEAIGLSCSARRTISGTIKARVDKCAGPAEGGWLLAHSKINSFPRTQSPGFSKCTSWVLPGLI
ncbi:MAG: hypothetical protein IPI67_34480 [Myxococcales bacterium]|nr:hypothetical protein [Myxococcales bacterium]